MELKSLILGLLFSVGIFAVKSGLGLSYLLQRAKPVQRLAVVLAFCCGYGVVFMGVWLFLAKISLDSYLNGLQLFFSSSMTIHFLFSALLLFWGTLLLRKKHLDNPKRTSSRAWVVLALPCPVCFVVILFATGMLQSLQPDSPAMFVSLYLGFIGISLTTAFFLVFLASERGNAEILLGKSMIFIAVYFLLTIFLVPQLQNIERIYRISTGSDMAVRVGTSEMVILAGTILLAFVAGFARDRRRPEWK